MSSCATSKSSSRSRRSRGFKSPIDAYCSSTSCEFMESSRLPSQQTISFATPIDADFPSSSLQDECVESPKTSQKLSSSSTRKSCKSSTSNRSSSLKPMKEEGGCEESDCDGEYSRSGSKPSKMAGALGVQHNFFAKYAPCGHWDTCKAAGCEPKKNFDSCNTCSSRAPYGPYGPWSKKGPAQFISPKLDYIKQLYPHDFKRKQFRCKPLQPMGNLAPWPLSGSCRFAGRPYGACRPFGAYKSRGPFGVWQNKKWPERLRPVTPAQPCFKVVKKGCRPCTPCHRPLFRPCKPDF